MKEKLYRFMQGRYGNDQLNRFLMTISILAFILSVFTRRVSFGFISLGSILYYIGILGLVFAYIRMFSKDTYKRGQENNRFLQWKGKVKGFFSRQKQRKTHHIYACPSCKQKIRVPRGKGKIEIRCPKCGTTFIKRS